MDSSNYNEYRNFISSLSEDNFNDLVLSYIKEYYIFIVICFLVNHLYLVIIKFGIFNVKTSLSHD